MTPMPPSDALRRSAGVLLDQARTEWGQATARWLGEIADAREAVAEAEREPENAGDIARLLIRVADSTAAGRDLDIHSLWMNSATFRQGVHTLAAMLPAMVAGMADETRRHALDQARAIRQAWDDTVRRSLNLSDPADLPPPGAVDVWAPHPDGRPRYLGRDDERRLLRSVGRGRPIIVRRSDGSTEVPEGYRGQLPPALDHGLAPMVDPRNPTPAEWAAMSASQQLRAIDAGATPPTGDTGADSAG
jgi:hypothetical protein